MSTTALALLVVIRLYEGVGIPERDLTTAMHITADALRSAHVRVEWLVCTGQHTGDTKPCNVLPAATDLIVRVMPGPGPEAGGDTLGHAAVDKAAGRGTLATIFADRVDRLAINAGIDPGVLLGRAIGHEVGHLLLGTTTHPSRGLMRARWASADLQGGTPRDWLFTPSEARELQRRVAEGPAPRTARR